MMSHGWARREDVVLWAEPARIVQARSGNADPRCRLLCLASRDRRAAVAAEAAFVLAHHRSLREMMAQSPVSLKESPGGEHHRQIGTSRLLLHDDGGHSSLR